MNEESRMSGGEDEMHINQDQGMRLQPLQLPLRGSHLIEASAGTGKTFTIAMLYVRLVLGHGQTVGQLPLTPPEILVVTFTEAATRELRDRIRARLAEAARYFNGELEEASAHVPTLLQALRADYAVTDWPGCARRLTQAAEWMDEAAVSTIHAWCYRMLREHAFDSLSLFDQVLENDQSELLAEVVRDYWRIFYYPLDAAMIETVAACWTNPVDLQKRIQRLLDQVELLPKVAGLVETLQAGLKERQQRLAELKQPWPKWVDELRQLLAQAVKHRQVDPKKLNVRWYGPWLDKLAAWAQDTVQEDVDITSGWQRLSRAGMAEIRVADAPLLEHPAFEAIEKLQQALKALPTPESGLLSHAAHWVAERFETSRKQRARMGFSDLLVMLRAALEGSNGDRLAQTLRQQFPVALIDEFQDTDPVQYAIFSRIYAPAENRQDGALILIGDPKQAIYAFRGADIYTYLDARRAMAGRLYTLDENFRSTGAMVDAVNHCFSSIEHRAEGAGAFLFRTDAGNPVPFHPVRAQGRAQDFWVDGQMPAALMFAVQPPSPDGKPVAKADYGETMASACASRIVAWLNAGVSGSAGFVRRTGHGDDAQKTSGAQAVSGLQPLRAGDIAVLVNNRDEAAYIRRALAQRGVRSVYLSDQESVFSTGQAMDVLRWLSACAMPDEGRLLRAALSTPALGLSWHALETLFHDETAWESRVVQFKAYREIWRNQGVLPMLRRILFDFDCPHRLLAQGMDAGGSSGERQLTDFLHLAELLQQASFTLEGEQALIRFLSEQIALPDGDADGRRLRLESDADLVQVVTIHKSKGLEYPLVFLPFICAARAVQMKDFPVQWHDAQGQPKMALQGDQDVLQRADDERLAEDMRKLYVAFTRARFMTWVGLAPLSEKGTSAISLLLDAQVSAIHYPEAIKRFAAAAEGRSLAFLESPDECRECFSPAAAPPFAGQARRAQQVARDPWWIGSYSALRYEGSHAQSRAVAALLPEESAQVGHMLEARSDAAADRLRMATRNAAEAGLHGFYKGAYAGTFLHDLMESAARTGFSSTLADGLNEGGDLRSLIIQSCNARDWTPWVEPLIAWVRQMLTTPLPLSVPDGHSVRLADLVTARPEMEFMFEARHVPLAGLDAMVSKQTLSGRVRPALVPEQLNGMLKGYIDLVFEHAGRYYIADYKSNWLGPWDESYSLSVMEEAICSHRYDIQYVLYLLALHRLLKVRLPDYDYDTHVGGALYLFVRGIGAATVGVHFERPSGTLIHALDAMFSGRVPEGVA